MMLRRLSSARPAPVAMLHPTTGTLTASGEADRDAVLCRAQTLYPRLQHGVSLT